MMKFSLLIAASLWFLGSCAVDCDSKLRKLYSKNQKALIQSQTVNGFKLVMSFLPGHLLPKAGNVTQEKDSTAFYYFKLQVECPPATSRSNSSNLHYGIDSLFSASDTPLSIPVLVEPVITGKQQYFEYLLVFPADSFEKNSRLRIFFLDRLFTNTRLAFEFDRSIIEEIETLPCYATKA